GLTLVREAMRWNSHEPNMQPWSVSASAGISNSSARRTRSSSRFAPSRSEYSLCVWRWTNDIPSGLAVERIQDRLELEDVLVLPPRGRIQPGVDQVDAILFRAHDGPGEERAAHREVRVRSGPRAVDLDRSGGGAVECAAVDALPVRHLLPRVERPGDLITPVEELVD